MAPAMAYALPAMQLVCNLIVPQTPSYNITTGPVSVTQSVDITSSPGIFGGNSTSQFPIPSATIPKGYVAYPDIGAAYKVSTNQTTWKFAKERCHEEGAHLAVIDNFIKFEYLMNQTTTTYIHVGIIHMYDDAEWVSAATGSTIVALPWASGEPNGGWDCVRTSHAPRGLRNDACEKKLNYACEIPISASYNTQENEAAGLADD